MGVSLSTTYVPNWQQECASQFNCSSDGLVNILGLAISCPVNSNISETPGIWGITFEACQAKCGMDKIIQSMNFSSAAVPLTTWLLPWIALIAQLPFEANGWTDLLSACLCVGSPALATYSLALTTFNRNYIAAKFKRLREKAEKDTKQRYDYMVERLDAAAFILQESQQCPLRADQRNGELASLVVLPDRQHFWRTARKDLTNTRRGFTYSFLAQVILAFASYLISFIAAVHDSLGSPDVGLQFATSSVWSWMFPIVFGYIRVGSQYKAGAIKEALVDNTIIQQRGVSEVMYQKGLRPDAELYSPLWRREPPRRRAASNQHFSTYDADELPPATESDHRSNDTASVPLQQLDRRDGSLSTNNPAIHEEYSETDLLLEGADSAELDHELPAPTWLARTTPRNASINFSSAAVPLTTWLLPWIALIAQLPFKTNGWMDLLSACLCVGSPALATYSLALTTFNRNYIAAKFKRLKEKAEKDTPQRYNYMVERVDAAAFILQESQQCPLRADQRNGELASLVVLPDRQHFWRMAQKDLANKYAPWLHEILPRTRSVPSKPPSHTKTRLKVILAFASYLISFIAAVHDSLGSPDVGLQFASSSVWSWIPDVGLQFASSSVWSWMFPIVFGYIRVGSQYKAGAIKEALVDNTIIQQRGVSEVMYQKGLRPDAELYPLWRRAASNQHSDTRDADELPPATESDHLSDDTAGVPLQQLGRRDGSLSTTNPVIHEEHSETDLLLKCADSAELDHELPAPTWFSVDVRGDERREGPIFNYARILTWFACAGHVEKAFENSIDRFKKSRPTVSPISHEVTMPPTDAFPNPPVRATAAAIATVTTEAAIPLVTAQDAADCCKLALREDLTAFMAWADIPSAAIQNVFYAALLALFLQWGTTGAAIFVAYSTPPLELAVGRFVSHALMQRLERNLVTCEESESVRDPYHSSTGNRMLGSLAVITEIAGKGIAITNAGWLIASSVLEEVGAFQTCWCQTDAFQYHTGGWTPVFKGQWISEKQQAGFGLGGLPGRRYIISIL
ncbi:hypothetical protein K438DRAFT_1979487 [Mycena galopus ATCC 62051]|nr:hypothetical protein K438DRAFT_1979487 [Mycena galopus ATCC 62051]